MFCKDDCVDFSVTPVAVVFTDSGNKTIEVFFTETTLYARATGDDAKQEYFQFNMTIGMIPKRYQNEGHFLYPKYGQIGLAPTRNTSAASIDKMLER